MDAQHYNKLYACTFRKRRRDDYLKRLDLAEHDIISPVVELHRVVVAHGVVAAEVDTLLAILNRGKYLKLLLVNSLE